MEYTIYLRNDDRDVVGSDEHLHVIIRDGCIVIGVTDADVLAIYPIKEVVKINKVVE